MYNKDEEFGGLLGMYLEGVKQAYHPVLSQNPPPKRQERAEKAAKKPVQCNQCCGTMVPAMCGRS